jgi:hypothetical protein
MHEGIESPVIKLKLEFKDQEQDELDEKFDNQDKDGPLNS